MHHGAHDAPDVRVEPRRHQPEIAQTWLGIVGPGVRNLGQDNSTWTDHTDWRPTILSLVGLDDSYVHDGRVVVEPLSPLGGACRRYEPTARSCCSSGPSTSS